MILSIIFINKFESRWSGPMLKTITNCRTYILIYVLARNMYNCRFYCEITTHFFQFLSIQAIAIKITIICNMSLNKKKIQQFFLLLKNKLFKLIIKCIEYYFFFLIFLQCVDITKKNYHKSLLKKEAIYAWWNDPKMSMCQRSWK